MPPKPVSIEAAKTHREAMKVRRIQEAAAEEKGLPNGWQGVEADTSFDYDQWVVDNAEPFKFSCSPLDLSELGPGVVLYFDLVKYLGVLTFCFAALHCVAIYFHAEAKPEIIEGNSHDWGGDPSVLLFASVNCIVKFVYADWHLFVVPLVAV